MRHKEALRALARFTVEMDAKVMARLSTGHFTSLILNLQLEKHPVLLERIDRALNQFADIIYRADGDAVFQKNLNAAHITVRSIVDFEKQSRQDLQRYLPVVHPIVSKWVRRMPETALYLMGFFIHFHKKKGLSLGIRVYPSLPLLQILRGEVAEALYQLPFDLPLRPRKQFHTMLTHTTLLRCRQLNLPLDAHTIAEIAEFLKTYDNHVFAEMSDIGMSDFCLRSGFSDRLLVVDANGEPVGEEISLAEVNATNDPGIV
jgi:hypothetical protein